MDITGGQHSWGVHQSMQEISRAECGVIVFLHRPETAAALLERAKPADSGLKAASKVDLRNYGIGAQILKDLKVTKMRLLAVPRKMPSMTGFDLEVTGYLLPQDAKKD